MKGLVLSIAGTKQNMDGALVFSPRENASNGLNLPDGFRIHPPTATLRKILSYTNFMARAGHEDHLDNIGDGVLRAIYREPT